MSLSEHEHIALLAEKGLAERRRDPLLLGDFRFFSSDKAREAASFLGDNEVNIRSGNKGAKTTEGARWVVAMMRGQFEIDGRTWHEYKAGLPYKPFHLPRMQVPNDWGHLVQSYKIASGASVTQMRLVLGDWPSHEAMAQAGLDYVGVIYVRPNNWKDDDWSTWSKLTLYPADGPEPEGVRLDGFWRDEPSPWKHWHAARQRNRGLGKPYITFSTLTPIEPVLWTPIKADFDGCEPPGRNGRVDVQWSMYDNQFLTDEDRRRQERDLEGKPDRKARLFGDYANTTGQHPWGEKGVQVLERWLEGSWDGELLPYGIQRTLDGGRTVPLTVYAEHFYKPEVDEEYRVIVDASAGIDDPEHDPGQVAVFSKRRPRLVALFDGYIGSYGLGVLAAQIAGRYNVAEIDPEMNAYGEGVLMGIRSVGYERIAVDTPDFSAGPIGMAYGFKTSPKTRGLLVGAAQNAVLQERIKIPSRKMIVDLLNIRISRTQGGQERVEAGPGMHDESLITFGRMAKVLERWTPSEHLPPKRETPRDIIRRELGLEDAPLVAVPNFYRGE